jgi:hypothetical protein
MSAASLPAWVEVGAPCLLVWGRTDENVDKMVVTKITPSGQVVVSDGGRGERRFMLRDFLPNGTAHKYLPGSYSSIDLYSVDHEKAPRLIAQQEERRAWAAVRKGIDRVERSQDVDEARHLEAALAAWRGKKDNLSALS